MWTDGGWYWVSDEQWAWATYHYGRWVYDSYYGWVWTPDTEWAPSWVSWREGDGYVGWAPLPPGASFGPEGYMIVREETLPPRAFVFVEIGHFSEPIHRHAVIVNNTTIINKTVNITRITRVNNVVVNHGPKVEAIEKVSSRKLTVSPPRGPVERRGIDQLKDASPKVQKPSADQQAHQPAKEEKAKVREPEIIRGAQNLSQPPSAGTGVTEPKSIERKSTEKPRVESPPVEKPHVESQPVERPRVVPPPPEKQPTREERNVEKRDRQEERKDEKEKKGEPGGN